MEKRREHHKGRVPLLLTDADGGCCFVSVRFGLPLRNTSRNSVIEGGGQEGEEEGEQKMPFPVLCCVRRVVHGNAPSLFVFCMSAAVHHGAWILWNMKHENESTDTVAWHQKCLKTR